MPSSLSAQLYGIKLEIDGSWFARFGYINRTAEPITRPVGIRNRFYNYGPPEGLGQPTLFEPGAHLNLFDVPMEPGVKNVVWVLDNTATAGRPAAAPSVMVAGIEDLDSGLKRVTFTVTNPHNQRVLVEDPTINNVTFGEGWPTAFPPGQTSWSVEAPAGMTITWTLGAVAAVANT